MILKFNLKIMFSLILLIGLAFQAQAGNHKAKPTAIHNGPWSGESNIAITFDGSASTATDATISAYCWNFGDGSAEDCSAAIVNYAFTADGDYTVSLTVTDSNGKTGTATGIATIATVIDPCTPVNGKTNVSVNGGCTSIQSAIDAAPGTADSFTVINVAPGLYAESLVLKSYIHVQGAGKDASTLVVNTALGNGVTIDLASHVQLSGFTLRPDDLTAYVNAFYITNSSPIINNNLIIDFRYYAFRTIESQGTYKDNDILNVGGGYYSTDSAPTVLSSTFTNIRYEGMYIDGTVCGDFRAEGNTYTNVNTGSILWLCEGPGVGIIKDNVIINDGWHAIYVYQTANISNNTITGSGLNGMDITGSYSNGPINITGNIITGSSRNGIWADTGTVSNKVFISHNKITNNTTDITSSVCSYCLSPNVSFNTYDTISGTATGGYNLKSDGTAW